MAETTAQNVDVTLPEQVVVPQVNVKARFFTGTDEALEFFKDNITAIVKAPEMNKLLIHLAESPGVELLAEQQVMTLSGRQAQIQTREVKTNILSGVVTESGQVVDLLPIVQEDGGTVDLTIFANKYKDRPIVTYESGGVLALPFVDSRNQIMAHKAVLRDGQTVALAKQFDGERVVIFVTPTLVAPDGNRVRSDSDLEMAH